ncbi:MAG TPA: DUF4198 domain-containing protein [Thermoanaerobaculia bacterium]|nr:DUF4198 domain-containing protein [Thermoanaerobaculia bacterium]
MKRLLFVIIICAGTARAHDFWIEPSTFRPAVGELVSASLRVGEDFDGEPVPRSSQLLETFIARDARNERAVAGWENADPAGFVRIDAAGATVLGYRSKPYPHTISADKFRQFLREEGVTLRVEGDAQVRERFIRYAKSLLNEGSDQALGFRYELVREGDSFRVLYEGEPLANALVVALHRDGTRVEGRSDAKGRVQLRTEKAGVWLVKSVRVVRAPAASGADWESLWASLTFER